MNEDANNYTPLEALPKIRDALRATFRTSLTKSFSFRKNQLRQLALLAQEHAEEFAEALYQDLGRPKQETYMAEVGPIVERSLICVAKLDEWSQEEDLSNLVPEWQTSWRCRVRKEAKGVVLIIAPWNYPMILSLQPLYGAIAAGCCAVLKLSEVSPHYAALLTKLLPQYLDQRAYRIVLGAIPEITRLLELQWDHIFYTGNGRVARIIAAAAAKHLTPVTLELGGKSPVILDPKCDVVIAAKRILWGKINNSGQICVTPDFVICPHVLVPAFVEALSKQIKAFFPEGALASDSFSRIVSEEHFQRLKGLLGRSRGDVKLGGRMDEDDADKRKHKGRKGIEPTVVVVEKDDALLEGEIFGPILPILIVEGVDEAIAYLHSRDHPLVLYAFTQDEETKEKILRNTTSGNIVFNDTFGQMAVNELPFGGVGESGYGRQVLKNSYDLFTYERAVTDVPNDVELMFAARYPPYTAESLAFMAQAARAKIPDADRTEAKEQHSVLHGLKDKVQEFFHGNHHSKMHEGAAMTGKEHVGLNANGVHIADVAGGAGNVSIGGGNMHL